MQAIVKKEEDDLRYEPPLSPQVHQHNFSASANDDDVEHRVQPLAETVILDKQLAQMDFFEKLCLVKVGGELDSDGKLWPALRYESIEKLQDAVKNDVSNVSSVELARIRWKIFRKGQTGSCGVAYLLGKGNIKESLLALTNDDMVEDFFSRVSSLARVDEIISAGKERYKDRALLAQFQRAFEVVRERDDELGSDDESATVALSSPPSPLVLQQAAPCCQNGARTEVKNEIIDIAGSPGVGVQSTGAEHNSEATERQEGEDEQNKYNHHLTACGIPEVFARAASSHQDATREEIDAADSPPSADNSQGKSEMTKKRKAGEERKQKKKTKGGIKTPKTKAKKTAVVTPGLPKVTNDEIMDIADEISPLFGQYNVMEHAEAWHLLQAKFGLTCKNEKYYFPFQEKPVATTLANLRKDLCAYGLPQATERLSLDEKINIARWVRYTHVAGMADGQCINPDDFGTPIMKFMDGWAILRDQFGCRYSSGKYTIPTSLTGETKKVIDSNTIEVEKHFARFGMQCISDDNDDSKLSKKDRLSLDIYFASPLLSVLDTFERIDMGCGNGGHSTSRRRRRNTVQSYAEP